jgi:hypothetical protein
MYTMILLLYLQSGLDVTLDQANLRGEFKTKAACEAAARSCADRSRFRATSRPHGRTSCASSSTTNVQVNDMKPVELGKLLQQNPPLGCQAEGAWARVAEMCAGPARPQPAPGPQQGGRR